jgi:transketolase
MRDRFIQTLCELAAEDPRIMLMTGDLGFAVLDNYRKKFPDQFINVGIAEQNMTLVATGMALEGHIVFTYSIGNFPTLRSLEMIRNDAAYHGANVKVVSVGGGFSYGPLGISHHATEDLAIMRSLPDVVTVAPSGLWETAEATKAIARTSGTCFLRLDKDRGRDGSTTGGFELGVPRVIKEGKDILFFVCGGILSEVIQAVETLEKDGLSCSVVSVHTLNPLRSDVIVRLATMHSIVVTVEEHTVHGGLGGLMAETLLDSGCAPQRFLRIGLQGCFSSTVGSQAFLRKVYSLDKNAIVDRTRALMRN